MDQQNNIIHLDKNTQHNNNLRPVDVKTTPMLQILATKPHTLPHLSNPTITTPLSAIRTVLPWIKKLWRTTEWKDDLIQQVITHGNTGNLLIAGKGIIRDQWGAYHWCIVEKSCIKKE